MSRYRDRQGRMRVVNNARRFPIQAATEYPRVVACARCGKDRWWVSAEVSPPFCKPCMVNDKEPEI